MYHALLLSLSTYYDLVNPAWTLVGRWYLYLVCIFTTSEALFNHHIQQAGVANLFLFEHIAHDDGPVLRA